MRVPHPIPYQGSKRAIANLVLSFLPPDIVTLVEPFAGSSAITLAAAASDKAAHFHLNDINHPLISLWRAIISDPQTISAAYRKLWTEQLGREREYYDVVRAKFNRTKRPEYLLYLLARCVKASIRYNSDGEFNQSPDNRRKGRSPDAMQSDIVRASQLLQGKTILSSQDYRQVLESISPFDVVYLDPPYQGVSGNRDARYVSRVEFDDLMQVLEKIVRQQVAFILSYDGRRGTQVYGTDLSQKFDLHRIEVEVGRSTQSTLLGGSDMTYESIYLSAALLKRLNLPTSRLNKTAYSKEKQLTLAL